MTYFSIRFTYCETIIKVLKFLYLLLPLLLAQPILAQNAVAFMGDLATPTLGDHTVTPPPTNAPAIVYIPFTLEGGMIFVAAELDGERASFILDTGAPGLVINNLTSSDTDSEVAGIQGEVGVKEGKVNSFRWGGVAYQEVPALLLDMSEFETLTGREIHGLIGYEFLKGRELFIDFDNRMISLRRVKKLHSKGMAPQEVSFSSLAHLPVVKMQINGKTGYFGLDTGSEINILHSRWKKRVKGKMIREGQIMGVDGTVKKVKKTLVSDTQIGSIEVANMEFHLIDLGAIEKAHGVRLDGILGFPFFQKHRVSLNFSDRKLCFW